jgi:hypothetical protein
MANFMAGLAPVILQHFLTVMHLKEGLAFSGFFTI